MPSTGAVRDDSLLSPATRWLVLKRLARPSPASDDARRCDLLVIARQLADAAGRPDVNPDFPPFTRQLTRVSLQDLTPRAFAEALAVYAEDHSPATVRRVVSTWRGFCGWLRREDLLSVDPTDGLEGPRRPDWKPKPLELAELGRLVAAAITTDTRARAPWPERDAALVAVLIGAGVRLGEIVALRVNDVEAQDRSPRLRVYGKGGRQRVVPVGPEVVDAVNSYLHSRRGRFGPYSLTDTLFVHATGKPFTRGTLEYLVSSWFRRAGVAPPPGALVHALRHTYATLLVDSGASLPEVQRLLGHRDLSTTQVYLGVTGAGLEQAALANPARHLLRDTAAGDGSATAGGTRDDFA